MDPFIEWLESLGKWDKKPRLDSWLGEVFRTDSGCELTKWASVFVLLGAVWRTYEPGTKLDEMPVLNGEQGCGKSTALRLLLPPEHPEWFADGLHLASDPRTRVEALQGRVIVEASEMAGITRAELESLKTFLSRTDDGSTRLAWRRNPETMLRRCVFVGSTNNRNCPPNDPSGNRRFVVVNVRATERGAAGVRRYLGTNREQLWAEAHYLYRMGIPAHLPENLKDLQSEANEEHRRRDDILEDKLDAWLEDAPRQFTLEQAARGVGLIENGDGARLPMRDQTRLGRP